MIPGFFPITKGGAEIFALQLCGNLVREGNQVCIITRNLNQSRMEKLEGIEVRRFKNILPYKVKYYGFGRFLKSRYVRMLVALFDLFSAMPAILKIVKRKQTQLLHASFILPFGLVGIFLKKLVKRPLIVTVHGPADFYEVPRILNPILRFVLHRADAVIAVGPKLKTDLLKRLGNFPIDIICNGVPIDSFQAPKNTKRLTKFGLKPDDFVILTAGRLVRRKNLDRLIQAIPMITEKISSCKFVLLGSGVEERNLKDLAHKLHVKSKIVMPGWVSEELKVQFFRRANIFIQLSQTEGLSLALLESKAAGLPAIIFGSGKGQNPVVHNETGLLINTPFSVDKIVNAIEYLWRKPKILQEMGRKARVEAMKSYSLERMVNEYISIYQDVLKKNR